MTMSQQSGDALGVGSQERLLLSVVEQLTRPLLHMRSLAELAVVSPDSAADSWESIRVLADGSLQLAESYALSLRLHEKITFVELEPIAISSLLYDAAQELHHYAVSKGVELELDAGPRVNPVFVDRAVLHAALTSLGRVFIDGSSQSDDVPPVRLSAHRSRYGMVTGFYTGALMLGTESLRQARMLQGRARQPLQQLVAGPAAGVFVAESLLGNVSAKLHVARYHKLTGLATTLTPSAQLQLV